MTANGKRGQPLDRRPLSDRACLPGGLLQTQLSDDGHVRCLHPGCQGLFGNSFLFLSLCLEPFNQGCQ